MANKHTKAHFALVLKTIKTKLEKN